MSGAETRGLSSPYVIVQPCPWTRAALSQSPIHTLSRGPHNTSVSSEWPVATVLQSCNIRAMARKRRSLRVLVLSLTLVGCIFGAVACSSSDSPAAPVLPVARPGHDEVAGAVRRHRGVLLIGRRVGVDQEVGPQELGARGPEPGAQEEQRGRDPEPNPGVDAEQLTVLLDTGANCTTFSFFMVCSSLSCCGWPSFLFSTFTIFAFPLVMRLLRIDGQRIG